uniref:small monomeric GTPase n=2 Tax=Castor canadensis TaxID=51338 RepID=A0A8C0W6D8_CASCN
MVIVENIVFYIIFLAILNRKGASFFCYYYHLRYIFLLLHFILLYFPLIILCFFSFPFRSTQIKTYSWDNAQVILVGNKCDMEDERVISTERGQHLGEQLGFEFFETSAKDNINVKQTFERLVDIICDKMSESLETDPAITAAKQSTRLKETPPPQQPNCGC